MSYLNETKNLKVLIAKAEEKVCVAYNIDRTVIYDRGRNPRSVQARFALFFLLNHTHKLSLVDIGKYYGLNHTTVLYGIRKAKKMKIPEELGYEEALWLEGGQYVEKALIHGDKGVEETIGQTGDTKSYSKRNNKLSTKPVSKGGSS